MTTLEYILSVLKLPFSDDDKAAMIVKLVNAGIAAGTADVSEATIAKAPALQAQSTPPVPVIAPDLLPPAKPPVPELPPARPPVPAPVYVPASGVTFHAEDGKRVDDIVPAGTPGTVTLPVTGHVVSLPSEGAGTPGNELFMGYLNRVKLQLGKAAADIVNRELFTLSQGVYPTQRDAGLAQDVTSWPEVADRLTNWDAYHTAAQLAAAAAARQQLISGMQGLAAQQPAPPAADPPAGDTVPVQFN